MTEQEQVDEILRNLDFQSAAKGLIGAGFQWFETEISERTVKEGTKRLLNDMLRRPDLEFTSCGGITVCRLRPKNLMVFIGINYLL